MNPAENSFSSGRILIVDDNRDVAESTKFLLEHHGFSTTIAEHGADALDKIARERISLVLLDLWMPVMDGWEFLRRKNNDSSLAGIPVIVVSAVASIPLGADAVLRKPVVVEALLAQITKRLGLDRNQVAHSDIRGRPR